MKFILFIIAVLAFAFWFVASKPPAPVPQTESLAHSASFAELSDAEKDYYLKVFAYVMETVQPGQPYAWQTYGAKGVISAQEKFLSKSKYDCRSYAEIFYVGTTPYPYEGVACKRQGREGWCRLKKTDALTCALEPPENTLEETLRDARDAREHGKGVWGKFQGWLR